MLQTHIERNESEMTATKRKRLIKTYGQCPAGWTNSDIERVLDVIYGMYNHIHTATELHHIMVSNPFDYAEKPRQMRIIDLTDWLEALIF